MTLIEEADRGDLSGISRLHRDASEFHSRWNRRGDAEPRVDDAEGILEGFQSLLGRRSSSILVARNHAEREPVGYVMGNVVTNKPFSVTRYGYVGCLYVAEEQRDGGVGTRLWGAISEWFRARGLAVAHVDVLCHNTKARRYWQSRGFGEFLDHLCRDTSPEDRESRDPGVGVRKAQAGDREAVILLWKEMMDSHARIDPRLRVGPAWRSEVAHLFRQWMRDPLSHLIVAETAKGVIGFALGGLVDVTTGLNPRSYGHVAHLCVRSDWRRRGVGRRLCASLEEWFLNRGVSSIHLYVSHFNPVSQRFWRTLGFEDYIIRLWCDLA